ncbi:hypothetical protein GCM10027566_16710 [Arachidicoccus ginsenosidivorans]|uniref:T9SS type A sorting domain-containing protein n=1 Tax=Arachidicoccus ginsenosidivorans TaxID=496057 RepID=A0A5B8VJR2_9BACT|nr:T9SS type A sorting domain-containing protein [Arachidicoccus ginsenosidivorans]QEC70846.1 T9SS type A sorting domain-containing protein [Arachidicoccus ginsenosidivorans]
MGAITATDNNLTVDPAFADATNGNYQLTAASPCIDAGTPDTTGLNIGTTDLAGSTRVAGSAIDIGAYEFEATLPVKLLVFKGVLGNNRAGFEWRTATEDNFNYFELQKSTDGKTFSTVATVNAKGNNSHYVASVIQVESAAYYRLKMVDRDGRYKFSKIVYLTQAFAADKLPLYPNPAKDYINISISQPTLVQIYNALGILVRTLQMQAGVNRLDIRSLPMGSYFVVAGGEKLKFIKK